MGPKGPSPSGTYEGCALFEIASPIITCSQVTVSDYLKACKCKGGAPLSFENVLASPNASQFLNLR